MMVASSPAASSKQVDKRCPLIKYILVVPKVLGNIVHARRLQSEYDDFADVVESHDFDPVLRSDTAAFVRKRKKTIAAEKEIKIAGEDVFVNQLDRLSQLDETWVAHYHATKLKVDISNISVAVVHDPACIKQMTMFFFNASLTTSVPALCRSQAIMRKCLDARCIEVGSRHEKVLAEGCLFPGRRLHRLELWRV
jgi:hypothetical protein